MAMDREAWKRDTERAKTHKELYRPRESLRGDRRRTNVMPSPFRGLTVHDRELHTRRGRS